MLKRLEAADSPIELAALPEVTQRARKRLLRNAAEGGGDDRASDIRTSATTADPLPRRDFDVDGHAVEIEAGDALSVEERARAA